MDSTCARVTGSMLMSQGYNMSDICIWGFVENLAKSGREFTLKTTDDKNIPVVMREPAGEYMNGLIEVRGQFDGRKINASTYLQFLREMTEDFDKEVYNKAVEICQGP